MCHTRKTLLLHYWNLKWHCVCHVDHLMDEVHIDYAKLYDRDRGECIQTYFNKNKHGRTFLSTSL